MSPRSARRLRLGRGHACDCRQCVGAFSTFVESAPAVIFENALILGGEALSAVGGQRAPFLLVEGRRGVLAGPSPISSIAAPSMIFASTSDFITLSMFPKVRKNPRGVITSRCHASRRGLPSSVFWSVTRRRNRCGSCRPRTPRSRHRRCRYPRSFPPTIGNNQFTTSNKLFRLNVCSSGLRHHQINCRYLLFSLVQ